MNVGMSKSVSWCREIGFCGGRWNGVASGCMGCFAAAAGAATRENGVGSTCAATAGITVRVP